MSAPRHNFVFLSGEAQPLKLDGGDRRFWVISGREPRTDRHATLAQLGQREALARCQGMHRVFYGNAFERHQPLPRTRPGRLRLIGRQLLRYLLSPRAFGRR